MDENQKVITEERSKPPLPDCQSLEAMAEELQRYSEMTGLTKSLNAVLKMLYEMEERPEDPLEFMRMHMTADIPERVELTNLQNEYSTIMQRIEELQQENRNMLKSINEIEKGEQDGTDPTQVQSKIIEENVFSDLSTDGVQ